MSSVIRSIPSANDRLGRWDITGKGLAPMRFGTYLEKNNGREELASE
jgi:hypothetical protein